LILSVPHHWANSLSPKQPALQALSPLGQAAIAYAARGWHVFPCRPRSKQPATPHGCKDATTDVQRITRYWQRVPDANVAIATGQASGIWVLDVDAPDGIASLRELEQRYTKLPRTITQRTGGGGWQLLWRWPANHIVRNSAGKLGPGLDTRGEGGYIVAPPSVHPDTGDEYVWLDHELDQPDAQNAPAWLLALVAEQPQAQQQAGTNDSQRRAIGGVLRWLAQQRPGNRNCATFWAAHRLREAGVVHEHAQALLVPIATGLGLPEREAARTIASAYGGGQ